MNLRTLTALGCIGVILAACGGGGDGGGGDLGTAPGPTAGGGTTSPAGIPSTALQSVDAFVAGPLNVYSASESTNVAFAMPPKFLRKPGRKRNGAWS